MMGPVDGSEGPLTAEEIYQRLQAKRDELARTIGGSKTFPEEVKEHVMEGLLRDEAARLTGADPAVMEAMGLIREHGVRRARKLYRDRSYRHILDATAPVETVERNARVAAYLEEAYEEQVPRWRRLLGI
jgi:hypothetical protein